MFFLKNYTSDVPVHQTLARIEAVLIKCGVLGIEKEYGPNAIVTALQFRIHDNGREFTIRLPANVEQALEAFWKEYVGTDRVSPNGQEVYNGYKKKRKNDFKQQAERTAWKIMQDWVEVQMSMVQMRQAEAAEVFMPYIWDGRSTVFTRVKQGGYRALLPEKTNDDGR